MKQYKLIGPILIISIWFVATKLKLTDSFFLPGPWPTLKEFYTLFSGEHSVLIDLLFTIKRVSISLLAAIAFGIPAGLLIGHNEKIYHSFESVIDFFRSTPATAIFPLFLLIFGVNDSSKIAVAAFTAMLIVIFNTAHGVMKSQKARLMAARIMGANRVQIFSKILFWESLPQTFVGLRTATSLALVVIIVTEMFIGTTIGLGRRIVDFQYIYDIKGMYSTIILTGALGYFLNITFSLLEKRVLHWVGR